MIIKYKYDHTLKAFELFDNYGGYLCLLYSDNYTDTFFILTFLRHAKRCHYPNAHTVDEWLKIFIETAKSQGITQETLFEYICDLQEYHYVN